MANIKFQLSNDVSNQITGFLQVKVIPKELRENIGNAITALVDEAQNRAQQEYSARTLDTITDILKNMQTDNKYQLFRIKLEKLVNQAQTNFDSCNDKIIDQTDIPQWLKVFDNINEINFIIQNTILQKNNVYQPIGVAVIVDEMRINMSDIQSQSDVFSKNLVDFNTELQINLEIIAKKMINTVNNIKNNLVQNFLYNIIDIQSAYYFAFAIGLGSMSAKKILTDISQVFPEGHLNLGHVAEGFEEHFSLHQKKLYQLFNLYDISKIQNINKNNTVMSDYLNQAMQKNNLILRQKKNIDILRNDWRGWKKVTQENAKTMWQHYHNSLGSLSSVSGPDKGYNQVKEWLAKANSFNKLHFTHYTQLKRYLTDLRSWLIEKKDNSREVAKNISESINRQLWNNFKQDEQIKKIIGDCFDDKYKELIQLLIPTIMDKAETRFKNMQYRSF